MSTVPVLIMLGNRLCAALLNEAQLALRAADYEDAVRCLHEFKFQVAKHVQAEAEILYPKLAALNPVVESTLDKLRNEHVEIRLYMQRALRSANEGNEFLCSQAIARLMDLLSGQWLCEQRLFRMVKECALDDILVQLAQKLKQTPKRWDDTSAR